MSYIASYVHIVFSTKERRPIIMPEMQSRLWDYIGGIARDNGMQSVIVGGIRDHIHALLCLPATMAMSKAAQLIKGGSSLWIHRTFNDQCEFAWQEKYGGFSVSVSQVDTLVKYIKSQEEHHRTRTFQEEFLMLLKKHRIQYDSKYIWD
jgi:REP element-mobilizing transposase RayT